MTQYFNVNNQVHVLDDGIDPLQYIKQPFTVITKAEADFLNAPPVPTLAQAQALQIAIINAAADTAFSAITATYPKQEVDTWPNQYAEATAFTANPLAPTPTLSAIATAMGSTVGVLAPIVLQKAAAYTAASGSVVGKRKLLTAQIQAATTVAEVQGVVW